MGKVEDMRALKQERLAAQAATRLAASAPARAAARTSAGASASSDTPGSAAASRVPAEAPATSQLCGHRSIGNKSCTRPVGHTEKNHRYAPAEPRNS